MAGGRYRTTRTNPTWNQQIFPQIAVAGAGAIGSLLGGLLARAGNDVTLIGRPEHVEAVQTHGLHIDGIMGEFTVPINAEKTLKFKPDLVLLTVKMPDVNAACRQIAPYIMMDVPVLTLQNGVQSDEIAANALGEHHIVGGIVLFNARFSNPGHVTYGSKGKVHIGETFRENGKRVKDIGDLLNRVIPTTVCSNIRAARWTKLLINVLGNSLEAMTGERLRACMQDRGMRNI